MKFSSYLIFFIVALLSCLNLKVFAAEPESAGNFIQGQDFKPLERIEVDLVDDLSQLEQVADIEFFYWYGCSPCAQIDSRLEQLSIDRPDLKIKRTPLIAYLTWREQAYIQPILEQLAGKVELPSQQDFYQQCIQDCSIFNKYESTLNWIQQEVGANHLPRIDESAVWQAEKNYRKRAGKLSISQVPTIIIKEKFVTDANMAQSADRMMQIIFYLLDKN
ncbi:MAG: hypothetical protein OQJ89_16175 [Kangiellaceae bacterium]|nr:hypothetical protein [Kangiellaceae bacterium]MCW9018511.1 hypothetical protein [Kangiellaceae bacterium]